MLTATIGGLISRPERFTKSFSVVEPDKPDEDLL
jgi:hypothetical protein